MNGRFAMVRGPFVGKTHAELITVRRAEDKRLAELLANQPIIEWIENLRGPYAVLADALKEERAERVALQSRSIFARVWARLREIRLP